MRRDKRRTSRTRATKKKCGNAKATKDNTKGAKTRIEDDKNNPVFASSDDEEDDNDAASLESSEGDFKEDDLESSYKSSASSPRMLKTKRKMKSDMTQPMKAGRPKKPAAVEGGQMPNYSKDEDYF